MGIWRSVSEASPRARAPADLRANTSAAAAVLFGASVVAVRVAVRDVPPVSLAVLRFGLGGAAAFLLWTWALSRLTPTQVAVYVNLNPVVAALLGVMLLGERRSSLFLLGFVAVVAGVLLVNWPGRRT